LAVPLLRHEMYTLPTGALYRKQRLNYRRGIGLPSRSAVRLLLCAVLVVKPVLLQRWRFSFPDCGAGALSPLAWVALFGCGNSWPTPPRISRGPFEHDSSNPPLENRPSFSSNVYCTPNPPFIVALGCRKSVFPIGTDRFSLLGTGIGLLFPPLIFRPQFPLLHTFSFRYQGATFLSIP